MEQLREKLLPGLRAWREEGRAAALLCGKMRKPFVILFLIYCAGISAIIRADFNYGDDMGRVLSGYKGWGNFGRYMSNFLSGFIHADNYLTDISPLPQLIALLFLALGGVMLLYIAAEGTGFSLWGVVAVVPLGLSPYFLGCLSYKYDAPYMALSILAGIAPVLLRERGYFAYVCAAAAGTLVVCTTYQAASGVFPMLVVLLGYRMWNRKEPVERILSFCVDSLTGYGLGMVLFRMFLASWDSYIDASFPPLRELPATVLRNYRQYYSLVRSDFKGGWLFLVFLLCAAFCWAGVRVSRRGRAAAALGAVAALLLLLLFAFGVYPLFQKPLFDARAMYGFGVFIALVAVVAVTSVKPANLACLVLSWCFFVFAFTYGNALAAQKTYTEFRIQALVDDLKTQEAVLAGERASVKLVGTIGQAPPLRHMPQDYQMLNRLVIVTVCENWYWGYYGIANYYGLNRLDWTAGASEDMSGYDLPMVTDNIYHTIYADRDHILIVLK